MTFGVDLIPNNNTQQRKLGNSENKWDINANTITATTINGNNVANGVKATQSAVGDPTADGTSLEFIDSISQNVQGVITPTKKEIPIANNLTETTTGKVLDATQGKILNDTKLDKDFNFTAATLPYSNLEKLALRGTDGNNYYTTIGELASQIGGSGGGTSQTALVHYVKNCGTISSLNWTNPTVDNNITENMVVLKAELSNPAAQTSDWTCTTSNGYITISGTINGSTNVLLYFGVSLSTAPSIIVNLASNDPDNVLKTNPTPGVMGVLGSLNGGTGVSASTSAGLLDALGAAKKNVVQIQFNKADYSSVSDEAAIQALVDTLPTSNITYIATMNGGNDYTCIIQRVKGNTQVVSVLMISYAGIKYMTKLGNTWTAPVNVALENTQHDTYTHANGAVVNCYRSGNVVTVNVTGIGSVTNISSNSDFYFDVGMDAKYRPIDAMKVYGVTSGSWNYTSALLYYIHPSGYISGYAYQTISSGGFTITYVV